MSFIAGRLGRQVFPLLGVLLAAAPAWALTADQIALVVNARVPASHALAELYAQERHIPDGRIIEINLDPVSAISPAEQMPFEAYEPQVAAPVREFLVDHHLQNQIKCLVTFWGVPLRIGGEPLTPERRTELDQLAGEMNQLTGAIDHELVSLEQTAKAVDPAFKPAGGVELPRLSRRMDLALTAIVKGLPAVKLPADRNARFGQMNALVVKLVGVDRAMVLTAQPVVTLFSPHPATRQDLTAAESRIAEFEQQIEKLQAGAPTAADRAKARALARDNSGLFGAAYQTHNQQEALSTQQTDSALDSELALLWWPKYPKARWVNNPLEWREQIALRQRHVTAPATLMVTRLDGPSEQIVRDIILTSVKVEAQGLHGQVAIDARGKTGKDPYDQYDQNLRDLADLIAHKTKLKLTFDNTEALIPAHSLRDIAVYCGWYSLRSFSSPGSFSPGAVGYHTASFELISLRQPNEHGWVRGLLSEGVVGTLGPVDEPYLQSFPLPDEIIPLILTGKMTLAEAYWRTTPWASWMQTCIGDPLYTPYKNDPALAVGDLPGGLGDAVNLSDGPPATNPAQ